MAGVESVCLPAQRDWFARRYNETKDRRYLVGWCGLKLEMNDCRDVRDVLRLIEDRATRATLVVKYVQCMRLRVERIKEGVIRMEMLVPAWAAHDSCEYVRLLSDSIEMHPTSIAFIERARVYMDEEMWEFAWTDLRRARAFGAKSEAELLMRWCLESMGQTRSDVMERFPETPGSEPERRQLTFTGGKPVLTDAETREARQQPASARRLLHEPRASWDALADTAAEALFHGRSTDAQKALRELWACSERGDIDDFPMWILEYVESTMPDYAELARGPILALKQANEEPSAAGTDELRAA
jgi:hypothetical protein